MVETAAEIAPWLVSGVAMLGLAATLLAVGFRRRANQTLALALVLHGLMELTAFARWLYPAEAPTIAGVHPYFLLPLAPSFLLFASVYPKGRAWIPQPAWGMVPALGAVLLLPLLYFAEPRLYWDARPGPLLLLTSFLQAGYGLVAFLLAREALGGTKRPSRRSALLLVSVAFALIHLYDAVRFLTRWRDGLPPTDADAWRGWLIFAADILALAVYLPLFGLILAVLAQPAHPVRGAMRAYGAVLFLAVAAALLFDLLATTTNVAYGYMDWAVAGLWDLSFPAILAYAVLRHQLFGIDLKLKWTIRQSTVSAAFVAAFFVASESAQLLFQPRLGPMFGIVAAGMLAFAWTPLQRFAERVADRSMPNVSDTVAYRSGRRLELYEVAVEGALQDGIIGAEDRDTLARLQDRLGISALDALRIERSLGQRGRRPA